MGSNRSPVSGERWAVSPHGSTGSPRGSTEVVVIHADASVLERTTRPLAAAGCEVRGFSCAEAALEAIVACPPDVVVSDLVIEGELGGLGLAQMLRAAPATCDIALIAITSHDEPADLVLRSFDAQLPAPVDPGRLLDLVRTCAARSELRESARRVG